MFLEVVEESSDAAIHGGKELVLQIREGIAVGIPGFIVTEVDLDEVDTGFDKAGSHQQRPAERVAAVLLQFFVRGLGDIECAADFLIDEKRDRSLSVGTELCQCFAAVECFALGVDVSEESETALDTRGGEAFGERQEGGLELTRPGVVRAALMVESVFGVGTVRGGIEGGCFDEPGIAAGAHGTGELAGDNATGGVDEFFGEYDRRRKIVVRGRDCSGDGGDAGVVLGARCQGIEAGREFAAAGQHDVVGRGVLVGGVGEGANNGPEVAALGQQGEVFADIESRGAGGDGAEFASDIGGSEGLGIEAVVLSQPAGEEDIDDGPVGNGGGVGGCPEFLEVGCRQAEQTDSPCLEHFTAAQARMVKG